MDFGDVPLLESTRFWLCFCVFFSLVTWIIILRRKNARFQNGLLRENARLQGVIQEMVDAQATRHVPFTPSFSNAGRSQSRLVTPTVSPVVSAAIISAAIASQTEAAIASQTEDQEVTQGETVRTRAPQRRSARQREDTPPESRHLVNRPHSQALFYPVKSPGVEAIYRSWEDCERAKTGGGVGSYKGFNDVKLALGFLDWVRPTQQR